MDCKNCDCHGASVFFVAAESMNENYMTNREQEKKINRVSVFSVDRFARLRLLLFPLVEAGLVMRSRRPPF